MSAVTTPVLPAAPASRRSSAAVPLALLATSLVCLLVVLTFANGLERLPIRVAAPLFVGGAVVLGELIRRSVRSQARSLAFLVYVVLCVFHLGLYLQPALTGTMATGLGTIVYWSDWYTEAALVRAGVVVLTGLLGYAGAVGLVSWLGPQCRAGAEPAAERKGSYPTRSAAALSDVGTGLLLIGVASWWFISVSQLGVSFVFGDYLRYLSATASQPLPYVYLAISVGTVLAAVRLRRRTGVVAVLAFLVFAVPGFVIGLRSEVLIPLVAAIPVWCRDPRNRHLLARLQRPGARLLLAGALVALLLGISFVQQVRLTGLQAVPSGTDRRVSALAAVQEMGYTIRVVITSLTWHDDLHEPYRHGATYVAPVIRAAERVLGLPRPEAEHDYGLMNVEIANRVGPIGGSMIGEAHHNFGEPGVIAVLALVGGLAAGIDRPRLSVWRAAWLGVVGLLALMHVRNSFAPLFAWGLAGTLAILAAMALSRLYRPRESP